MARACPACGRGSPHLRDLGEARRGTSHAPATGCSGSLIRSTQVARANLAHAGLADKVKVALGPAADTLKKLQPAQPYDFAFIDADKPNNTTYFIEAKRLVRKGGVIVSP